MRDDKLNAGEAATRTLELIEKDKVHAVVGALSSAVQLAVNEVTRARGVIYVSISQSDTINEVKDFSKYTFHEALNPHMTTAAVARQTLKKGMKVAHLVADYAYGHEMLRGFKRAQTAIGADNVGEILHPFGAADYSTFMPRLMSMRPDMLCISNFGRDQANSIKQAVDFGVKQQMKIVVPVILHNQRLAVGPDVFEGVVGGANYYWGLETQSKSAASFQRRLQGCQWRRDPDRLRRLRLYRRRIVAGRPCRPRVAPTPTRWSMPWRSCNMTWPRARSITANATTSRCSRCWCWSPRRSPPWRTTTICSPFSPTTRAPDDMLRSCSELGFHA